jgi:hypothetical protein
MLLHWLAGLGGDAYSWQHNANTDHNRHSKANSNPTAHSFGDIWPIPHPQPAYRYSDVHNHSNVHGHGYEYHCAIMDAVPAADNHPYTHLDAHPTDGYIYSYAGAAHTDIYPHPANCDIYSYASASQPHQH